MAMSTATRILEITDPDPIFIFGNNAGQCQEGFVFAVNPPLM